MKLLEFIHIVCNETKRQAQDNKKKERNKLDKIK